MNTIHNGYIETYTGRFINPLKPAPDAVFIEDIAHSLSMQCRFNGHCSGFYSVAEHSVHTAEVVQMLSDASPETAKFALLHDAAEAYLCDIPRPVKKSFPGYAAWEQALFDVICDRFIGRLPTKKETVDMYRADDIMLVAEAESLTASKGKDWGLKEKPLDGIEILCWNPGESEEKFLDKYRNLLI